MTLRLAGSWPDEPAEMNGARHAAYRSATHLRDELGTIATSVEKCDEMTSAGFERLG
jgi:hypothetical protein